MLIAERWPVRANREEGANSVGKLNPGMGPRVRYVGTIPHSDERNE